MHCVPALFHPASTSVYLVLVIPHGKGDQLCGGSSRLGTEGQILVLLRLGFLVLGSLDLRFLVFVTVFVLSS